MGIENWPEYKPRIRIVGEQQPRLSRRHFNRLLVAVGGIGLVTALVHPKSREAIIEGLKSLPAEDENFYESLGEKRGYWEALEEYQVGQKIEKAQVTSGGFPDEESVRVRAKPSLGGKEILRLSVGEVINNGEIIKGGYVPMQGGEAQSNRWLKFKLEIEGEEKTGYISAIHIQELKPEVTEE